MEIIFKKGNSKNTITCRRDDGTSTWMEAEPFMIIHDLTHYAVETSLRFDGGFYGLVEDGFDITDFQNKQKFKPKEMPPQAAYAEILVNLFLTERSDRKILEDFDSVLSENIRLHQLAPLTVEKSTLDEIRSRSGELMRRWRELPPGEVLKFCFPQEKVSQP